MTEQSGYSCAGMRAARPDRTDLELLILALVERGLATAYDFKTKAGISVASSLSALRRLTELRLVVGQPSSRRSVRYALTPAGKRVLRNEVRLLGQEVPADFEAILRVGYLIWLYGGSRSTVAFLTRSAKSRGDQVSGATDLVRRVASNVDPWSTGLGHRWMRALADIERVRGDALALNHLASRLAEFERSHPKRKSAGSARKRVTKAK